MSDPLEKATRNVPLAPKTTMKIGGPAALYLEVDDEASLRDAVTAARSQGMPLLILGGGSNVVVSDAGFDGLVLTPRLTQFEIVESASTVTVMLNAGAGINWDELVARTVARNLAGFECLSGIPGDVGATPIQNVGAYGQEVGDTLVSVRAFDRSSGRFVTLSREECELSYRDSRFKSRERNRFIITSVSYRLEREGEPTILYPELQGTLEERGFESPSLHDVRETVLSIRSGKGMVIDPDDPDSRSAGSFFTNPILDSAEHDEFRARVSELGLRESVRTFPTDDGRHKLSAAWLIDHSGFSRGHVHGGVGLSSKHVLAIINRGEGTAREVRELATEIQAAVRERFGVALVPEPNFVGDHDKP